MCYAHDLVNRADGEPRPTTRVVPSTTHVVVEIDADRVREQIRAAAVELVEERDRARAIAVRFEQLADAQRALLIRAAGLLADIGLPAAGESFRERLDELELEIDQAVEATA